MKFGWIKARQTKYTAYFTVYLLVVLAVLGAVNFLANRHNKSLDTTTNKRFSLSDQTEKVVKNLKQDVKVTLYDQTSRFAQARDLLDRYDNLSAKLSVSYVDPYKKPQQARAAGVRTEGTVFVETGVRKEEARSLTEEEVTGAIIRSLKGGDRTVCFVAGSGEHSLDETGRRGYSSLKEALEKSTYKTRAVSLLEKPEVPKDCTILVVGGPRFDYVEPSVKAIKTYVEGGGRALLMLDPPLKLGRDDSSENKPMVELLSGWGVVLNTDLALDTSGVGQLFGLGPEVPLVTSYESHAIVREMKEIATAFPLSRSLDTKTADKVTAEKLFSTSGNSYATSNLNSPQIKIDAKKDKKGPLTLGVAGTYNTGQQSNQGRFVAIGSSEWCANGFLRFNGNRDLFLNTMNWLSSDEELISIRPKEPEDRRLNLTKNQMTTIFYSSVIFLPLVVVAAGVSVWWRRR
jgi:ABC-type uncharacterized transport system involved in gliding motility auxiliary subunit